MSCQRDQYLVAIYGIVSSITLITTGVLFLFEQSDMKRDYDRDMKGQIEDYNEENPPTNTSEASPDLESDLEWKKMYLL